MALLFLGYALMQNTLHSSFFQKAQYSLSLLLVLVNREPYLTGTLNFLSEEIIQGHAQVSSKGIDVYIRIGEDLFLMYYNKTLDNDALLFNMKHDLGLYYPDFNKELNIYEENSLCAVAFSHSTGDEFTLEGCKQDAQGVLGLGIRQAVGVSLMYAFQYYHNFLEERDKNAPGIVRKYLDDQILKNYSNFTGQIHDYSGYESRISQTGFKAN